MKHLCCGSQVNPIAACGSLLSECLVLCTIGHEGLWKLAGHLVAVCKSWVWQSLSVGLGTDSLLKQSRSVHAALPPSRHSRQHEEAAAEKGQLCASLGLQSAYLMSIAYLCCVQYLAASSMPG